MVVILIVYKIFINFSIKIVSNSSKNANIINQNKIESLISVILSELKISPNAWEKGTIIAINNLSLIDNNLDYGSTIGLINYLKKQNNKLEVMNDVIVSLYREHLKENAWVVEECQQNYQLALKLLDVLNIKDINNIDNYIVLFIKLPPNEAIKYFSGLDNFSKKEEVKSILIEKPGEYDKRLKICINKDFDNIIRPKRGKGWEKIIAIVETGSCEYSKNLMRQFNKKGNLIYSRTKYKPTEILKEENNFLVSNIDIKLTNKL